MDKVFLSLALIISGLTLGYVLQNLDRRAIISLPVPIADLRKLIQKAALLFILISDTNCSLSPSVTSTLAAWLAGWADDWMALCLCLSLFISRT